MKEERWRRIEELYHAARLLNDSARASFLTAATEGDEELRREVESLLVSGASSPGLLDEPLQVSGAAVRASDAASLSGRRIGTYSVHERIGAGGMGEVYRAHDSKLRRDVAFKVLAADLLGDHEQQRQDHLRRFRQEAHALAALNHPNIAAIYGLEEADGVTALVMELVDGSTLADRIIQGAIPVDEALPIATQIAEALEAAHERGIVHRDLKPANIKLRSDGTVKVLDFGLAKAVGPAASVRDVSQQATNTAPPVTATGVIVGTAAYMSPEQAAGKTVDHRADIWAFGCVLFEMLTGRAAFGGDTLTDTLAAVMRAEPDWSRVPVGVTDRLRELLRRCLRKDPRQRFQAIGDARIALEDVLSGQDSGSVQVLPASSARRRNERAAWIVAGVAMIAAMSLATGFYLESRSGEALPLHASIPLPPGWNLALSSSQGEPTPLVVSPDGRRVAFVARQGDGPATILMRELDAQAPRPLAGTEGASSLFWSPDNRFIGFFADGKIKKVDVSGGVPTVVCAATAPFGGGTWGEGTIVFSMPDKGTYRLWKVAEDGGGQPADALPDASTSKETYGAELRPWFLPDGRTLLYVSALQGQRRAVYVGRLDSTDREKVVETDSSNAQYANGYLLFLRGATLMAQPFDEKRLTVTGSPTPLVESVQRQGAIPPYRLFSASQTGVLAYQVASDTATLAWVDRQGHTLGTIGEPANYRAIALSHDETRVAAVVGEPAELFIINLESGVRQQFALDNPGFPVWSHDDRFIDFNATPPGSVTSAFRKPSNGAGRSERILPDEKGTMRVFDRGWDDSILVMIPRNRADLTIVPGTGNRTPFRLASTPQDKRIGKFSPDARWVAYVSNELDSVQNVWVAPVIRGTGAGDVKWPISDADGGTLPQWSADSHELFYISSSEMLTAVHVNGDGQAFQLLDPPKALFPIRVSQSEGGYRGWHYAVSNDGRRFLVIVSSEAPVSIEVNWTARLKR
jgi:serine/threonine protein kinase/Tol biopolymer transport system component